AISAEAVEHEAHVVDSEEGRLAGGMLGHCQLLVRGRSYDLSLEGGTGRQQRGGRRRANDRPQRDCSELPEVYACPRLPQGLNLWRLTACGSAALARTRRS